MTAKGFATFSIALLSLLALDPGQARIAPWPAVAPGEHPRPLADGWRARGPAPDPDTRRRGGPGQQGQQGGDGRAIDNMPRSTAPAER